MADPTELDKQLEQLKQAMEGSPLPPELSMFDDIDRDSLSSHLRGQARHIEDELLQHHVEAAAGNRDRRGRPIGARKASTKREQKGGRGLSPTNKQYAWRHVIEQI